MSNYGRARPYVTRQTPQQYRDRQDAIRKLHQLQFDEWISRRSPRRYASSYSKMPRSSEQIKRDQIESRIQAKAYRIQQEDYARERAREAYLLKQKLLHAMNLSHHLNHTIVEMIPMVGCTSVIQNYQIQGRFTRDTPNPVYRLYKDLRNGNLISLLCLPEFESTN